MVTWRHRFFLFIALILFNNSNARGDVSNTNSFYTIISDSQFHSEEGILKAQGNVIIESENDLQVYADNLIFEKKSSRLHLFGNVILRNYVANEIFVEDASGDELIIFLDKGSFEFKKKEGERVKTKFRL